MINEKKLKTLLNVEMCLTNSTVWNSWTAGITCVGKCFLVSEQMLKYKY